MLIRLVITAAFAVIVALYVRSFQEGINVVNLGYATYQGVYNSSTNITSFRGIRYGAPPTGDSRWRSPQPPENIPGLHRADTQAKQCFQGVGGGDYPPVSHYIKPPEFQDEDCLFLNVFVPGKVSPSADLPVIVWLHGGGYAGDFRPTAGADGGDFIRIAKGDIIAVLIQYRTNIFGFLAGEQVKANGTLNVGLLDQQLSFIWVQKHIEKFGGDPSKVTIWGVSAGAGSVLQHVVARGGADQPLFHAALTSSTYLPAQYPYNHPITEGLYQTMVDNTNCSHSRDTLTCLRSIDASMLISVYNRVMMQSYPGVFLFSPVIDGDFIAEHPIEALRKRKVNGATALSVTDTFEGRPFVKDPSDLNSLITALFPNLPSNDVNAIISKYQGIGPLTTTDQAIALTGEATFICASYYLVNAFGRRGWKGEYAVSPANHGGDLGIYLPSAKPALSSDSELRASYAQPYIAVAKYLNPNIKFSNDNITPHWESWNETVSEMKFDITSEGDADIRMIRTDSGLVDRCRLWQDMHLAGVASHSKLSESQPGRQKPMAL